MSQELTIYTDNTTNALAKSLEAPQLDPVVLAISNEYLAGKDLADIAVEYNITPDVVSAILDKKDVKSYIDNVYLSQGYLNRMKRIKLINNVIEQKVSEALESGIFSKRDLLDWLKYLQAIEDSTGPKDKGPQVAVQVNNYDSLMRDLMEK